MTTTIKWFWNGFKVNGSKALTKAHYSFQKTQLTVYGKEYKDFPPELAEVFTVENNTDLITDYFDNDKIRIEPSHPEFQAAAQAYIKQEERAIQRMEKNKSCNAVNYKESLEAFKAEFVKEPTIETMPTNPKLTKKEVKTRLKNLLEKVGHFQRSAEGYARREEMSSFRVIAQEIETLAKYS